MKCLFFILGLLYVQGTHAQTWSSAVAQIVYDKCTKCHHPGGIAPFSLMTYSEASPMAAAIYNAVTQESMPPWPPDNNYQTYVHNRALSATEKTTLQNWAMNGALEGNPLATPPPPVYSTANLLGNGDLTVKMPTYMSKATSTSDDYACFAVPTGLLQNRIIKSIEVIPGNREIVHHALIYIDPTGTEVTDSISGTCGSPGNNQTKLVAGYVPGSSPLALPAAAPLKLGINIEAGSSVYFAMHYPSGSYGALDSTKVIFHFYPLGTTNVRQVSTEPVLRNINFILPPNQLTTVEAEFPISGNGLPANISILSVFPHMHLLGKTMKVYGLKPNNDTLKLIQIPHWDFHWQDFYFFKNIQVAPAGTSLHAQGLYDNTVTNVHNPNNPPQTVTFGLNTSDEMFLVYFHYMPYQLGDENYDMDELMSLSLEEQLPIEVSALRVFPNPSSGAVTIQHAYFSSGDTISTSIYDAQGILVKQLTLAESVPSSNFTVVWDGTNANNVPVKKGIYFVSMLLNGIHVSKKIVKQ